MLGNVELTCIWLNVITLFYLFHPNFGGHIRVNYLLSAWIWLDITKNGPFWFGNLENVNKLINPYTLISFRLWKFRLVACFLKLINLVFIFCSFRIDELVSEQTRHISSGKQKDERLQSLKGQLEGHLNKNHSLNNELNMREEKLKSLKKRCVLLHYTMIKLYASYQKIWTFYLRAWNDFVKIVLDK